MASDLWYYISRTQNVCRLKGQRFLVHFPDNSKPRPLCGKSAPHQYRRLSVKEWHNNKLAICEDCLTIAGEH